jgi:hypothetical protein
LESEDYPRLSLYLRTDDTHGRFTCDCVPAGTYTVGARLGPKPAVIPAVLQQATIRPGATTTVDLVFPPGGTIIARVAAPHGAGVTAIVAIVEGAVQVADLAELEATLEDDRFRDWGECAFVDNARHGLPNGVVRFERIPVGTYTILAEAQRYHPERDEVERLGLDSVRVTIAAIDQIDELHLTLP